MVISTPVVCQTKTEQNSLVHAAPHAVSCLGEGLHQMNCYGAQILCPPLSTRVYVWHYGMETPHLPSHQKRITLYADEITIFLDSQGIILAEFQDHGETLNTTSYCVTLKKMRQSICWKCPGLLSANVILLDNNGRLHTARTKEPEKIFGLEHLKHPPYSPNLATSDFQTYLGPWKITWLVAISKTTKTLPRR